MIQLTEKLTDLLCRARKIEALLVEVSKAMDGITARDLELAELLPTLTERELEILTLMTKGMELSDLPKILGTSLRTVQAHRWNIQKKLKLKSSKDINQIVIPWMQKKS